MTTHPAMPSCARQGELPVFTARRARSHRYSVATAQVASGR